MDWERWAWLGLGVAALALEAHTLKEQTAEQNDTGSEMTRIVFRTDTQAGRLVFRVTLRALEIWYAKHVPAQPLTRKAR